MAVWWATEAFWAVGFICLWVAAGVGGDLQLRVYLLFFRKGRFPLLLGDPYGCPRQ
jgi:hypothetical protein